MLRAEGYEGGVRSDLWSVQSQAVMRLANLLIAGNFAPQRQTCIKTIVVNCDFRSLKGTHLNLRLGKIQGSVFLMVGSDRYGKLCIKQRIFWLAGRGARCMNETGRIQAAIRRLKNRLC